MHEFGICEEIVSVVQRRAQGRRVAKLRIRMGALHRVSEEAFRQAFSWAAAESEAQAAALDLVFVPVRVRCGQCTRETESADGAPMCGSCGSVDLEVVQGDELIVESIEFEQTPPDV